MSYYGVSMDMYQVPDAGTPGWNLAPVPGWGANPLRSGPPRVGVGGSVAYNDAVLPRYAPIGADEDAGYAGDKYLEYSLGHVAFAVVGGMALGAFFTYLWYLHNQSKS
jgi:hypothetical protein